MTDDSHLIRQVSLAAGLEGTFHEKSENVYRRAGA